MKKSILITGATSGIGWAMTVLFGRNGYRVFATYRHEEDGLKLDKIEGVHPIRMDVTDNGEIQAALEQISDLLGGSGLYAIINNAGITYTAPFEYAKEERVRQVIDVNVMAPYKIAQTFIPLLKQYSESSGRKSRIINIASWAGYSGQPFIPFYNASKAALIRLSESMHYDLGLLGIHTILVSPGITKTPLLEKTALDGLRNLQECPKETQDFYQPYLDRLHTLVGKFGRSRLFLKPEKVAEKLYKIVEARNPRFKYNLGIDTVLIDGFLTKLLPFKCLAAMNRTTYGLPKP